MSVNLNKIVDMYENIMHSLISLNCEMLRQNKSILSGEERLKNDIKENKNICPMEKCIWNTNGKCNQYGMDYFLKQCRESSYKYFEADTSQNQIESGYLGKC